MGESAEYRLTNYTKKHPEYVTLQSDTILLPGECGNKRGNGNYG